MKRVVTGVNAQGRSYIVSSEEIDTSVPSTLWDYEPIQMRDHIRAIKPGIAAEWVGPNTAGGVRWLWTPLQPEGELTERPALDGFDENGFHITRTIDFDVVVDGELTMVLDEDRIRLRKGDIVIQQATRHAWKNESDKVAVLLALVHSPCEC